MAHVEPTFGGFSEVDQIIARVASGGADVGTPSQYAILFALLAGTGLRVGEALALKVSDVKAGNVCVTKALWNGRLQTPKTDAGKREVDLHSSLAVVLDSRIANLKISSHSGTDFLFTGDQRTHLEHLHAVLDEMKRERCGFHAFRRFRVTHLRKARIPENLIRYWTGHSGKTITDDYDRVREDREFRRFTCEQVGLGFTAPEAKRQVSNVRTPVAPLAPSVKPQ